MDNQQYVKLFDGTDKGPERPLRRPNITAPANMASQSSQNSNNHQNLESSFGSLNLQDVVSNSKLSVDAKEWFPPQYNSVQGRLQKFKNTDSELAYTDSAVYLENGVAEGCPSDSDYCETSHDINKLHTIINTLSDDPGQFDELLGRFIETLGPYYEDINVVSMTAEILVDQAICDPNFRYTAARLCCTIEEQSPLFRSTLHILCGKKLKDLKADQGLALFLAELYAQLHYDNLYGRSLLDILNNLVKREGPDNIKCVCQALKLTGHSLDSFDQQEVNSIINKLETMKNNLPSSIKNLVGSVITLKGSNWGQNQNSPQITNNSFPQPLADADCNPWVNSDGPVFYGPDGKEMTEEERQFLADSCDYESDNLQDDQDPIGMWDPDPEMDEEVQAAFRQFVQLSRK